MVGTHRCFDYTLARKHLAGSVSFGAFRTHVPEDEGRAVFRGDSILF
jgi:hypothetical protein